MLCCWDYVVFLILVGLFGVFLCGCDVLVGDFIIWWFDGCGVFDWFYFGDVFGIGDCVFFLCVVNVVGVVLC